MLPPDEIAIQNSQRYHVSRKSQTIILFHWEAVIKKASFHPQDKITFNKFKISFFPLEDHNLYRLTLPRSEMHLHKRYFMLFFVWRIT